MIFIGSFWQLTGIGKPLGFFPTLLIMLIISNIGSEFNQTAVNQLWDIKRGRK